MTAPLGLAVNMRRLAKRQAERKRRDRLRQEAMKVLTREGGPGMVVHYRTPGGKSERRTCTGCGTHEHCEDTFRCVTCERVLNRCWHLPTGASPERLGRASRFCRPLECASCLWERRDPANFPHPYRHYVPRDGWDEYWRDHEPKGAR